MRDEFEDESEGGGLDLKVLILYGALRSRGWLLLTTILGASTGLFLAASQPNVYTSEARLQYTPGIAETRSADDAIGIDDGIRTVPGIEDEIMLLTDPRVFERVAQDLTPSWVLRIPDPTAEDGPSTLLHARLMHGLQAFLQGNVGSAGGAIRDNEPKAIRAAAEILMDRTRVLTGRRSQVIVVQADAWTPEDAQLTATALVKAFIDQHNEHYSPELNRLTALLDEQEEKLRRAGEDFREHKGTCGFYDLEAERDGLLQAVSALDNSVLNATTRRSALLVSIRSLEARTAGMGETITVTELPRQVANPEIPRLLGKIDRMKERREDIEYFDRENDPVRRAEMLGKLNQDIDDLTREMERLMQEEPVVDDGIAVDQIVPNSELLELQVSLAVYKADLEGIGAQLVTAQEAREKQIERLRRMDGCVGEHSRWRSDIEAQQGEVSRLRSAMVKDQGIQDSRDEGESNLRTLTTADLQPDKTGPERMKLLAGGLFGGLALGMAIAVLRQLRDRRLRYRENLEKALDIPVLAVIDEYKSLRKLRPNKVT